MPSLPLPSRRQFALFSTTALLAACRMRSPRVPTRPAPSSSGAAGELLDTEDGTIPIDAHDPQRGPRTAFAVIVVFTDFQCPFCRDVAGSLERLHKERAGRVRVVLKHLPIPSHAHARAAAIAAQAVLLEAGPESFWRFHDRCFAHPRELDPDHLAMWARDEGVSPAALTARGPEADAIVKQHMALAERMGIRGTPRLYINARRVAGAYPYEQLLDWVDDEL